MRNNTITSNGETGSPSAPAEHLVMVMLSIPAAPPANGRSAKVCREFSGLVTRPYCSMSNIAVVYGVDDAIQLQSPSSRASTRPVFADPAERDVQASGDLTGPLRQWRI
uniref:Uncharacterized protein n=1 Tax=Schizaphis graminum TaxID=13262 RepID=A0A2S2P5R7_SCHGA